MEAATRGLTKANRPMIRAVRVEVTTGPDQGSIASTTEKLTVGTAPGSDLVLTDKTVSRFHVDVVRGDDSFWVIDHRSTNGTWVGDVKIERAAIRPGTTLVVGKSTLRVTDGDPVELDLHQSDRLGSFLGRSESSRKVMAQLERIAPRDVSVLIMGETGTGKEVGARTIHDLSQRSSGPFETVDCGAMLPTLMASELFGHEKGAFTGADRQHIGAFERANGGTLFLDEIGELPTALQSSLLGALERRQFRRVGGDERIDVDVRLISATNRDLRAEVNAGRFRPDLYYRMAVVTVELPPLRDRAEDIPVLVEHFLRKAGSHDALDAVFPERAMAWMKSARWPGNVRELRNLVEAVLATGQLPSEDTTSGTSSAPAQTTTSASEATLPTLTELLEMGFSDARGSLVDAFEIAYVTRLIDRCDGNVSEAARLAKIHRSLINRLLTRHGIRVARVTQPPGEEHD